MKSLSAFSVAAVLMFAGTAQSEDRLQQTLLAQEIKLIEAIKQQNRPALETMLGQQKFAVTTEGGRQTDEQLLRSLDNVTMTSYRVDDVKCVEVSPDVGILTYKFAWAGTYDGQAVPETTVLATSTWARRDGQWRTVFYQETPLAAAVTTASK